LVDNIKIRQHGGKIDKIRVCAHYFLMISDRRLYSYEHNLLSIKGAGITLSVIKVRAISV
jgi:hypothetical protein